MIVAFLIEYPWLEDSWLKDSLDLLKGNATFTFQRFPPSRLRDERSAPQGR
jgi:hypothetical protein